MATASPEPSKKRRKSVKDDELDEELQSSKKKRVTRKKSETVEPESVQEDEAEDSVATESYMQRYMKQANWEKLIARVDTVEKPNESDGLVVYFRLWVFCSRNVEMFHNLYYSKKDNKRVRLPAKTCNEKFPQSVCHRVWICVHFESSTVVNRWSDSMNPTWSGKRPKWKSTVNPLRDFLHPLVSCGTLPFDYLRLFSITLPPGHCFTSLPYAEEISCLPIYYCLFSGIVILFHTTRLFWQSMPYTNGSLSFLLQSHQYVLQLVVVRSVGLPSDSTLNLACVFLCKAFCGVNSCTKLVWGRLSINGTRYLENRGYIIFRIVWWMIIKI